MRVPPQNRICGGTPMYPGRALGTRRLQVRASTTPSAGRPAEDWKDVTPAAVAGPKAPSTVVAVPCAVSWLCTAFTALPEAPVASGATAWLQVWLPATPSAAACVAFWKAVTAACVAGP